MELAKIGLQVEALARHTGKFVQQEAGRFSTKSIEVKGLNDLVSYVDKQAELQLVDGLKHILPQAGFIAEEGTASQNNEEYIWIVDPLDGTTNFMHGLPVYSISIALQKQGKTILGLVYELNKDELFYAHLEGGAFLNGKPIHVSTTQKLAESLLATGFPYHNFNKLETYLNVLAHFMQHTHGLRRMGSAAVDLAYVACGRFEGFFEYNLNAWDVAAGAFIVQEAGGSVSEFDGGEDFLFGNSIIAAGSIYKDLQQTIHFIWN